MTSNTTMIYENYDFKVLEPKLVDFWEKNQIVEKLRNKNINGKKFFFLDGPPYTSGKFHLAHAWNYALKDIGLRYKRSQGFNVWDRNGFDVHGLPTEHKVMSKYNLVTKEDIVKFGLDKFISECQKFCLEMADVMTQDLVRMGITVAIKDPYMALKTEFMEGEWALIKKAYEQKRLYYGEKVLTWCQHCETAVAKHECEYENVKDKSIFVKFPVKGKSDEFLIIWTTTPWTIPFNLAVMVGPDIDYVKVEVAGEKWILAKALAGMVVGAVAGKKMEVVKEFKGKDLEGLEYIHPFEKYLQQYKELKRKHKNVHTVILSEQYVDTTAGTGLVHSAPGCGPEDQEACKPYDIPPFNALEENGFFPQEMGKFAGMRAKVDDHKFTDLLNKEGVLIDVTEVEHEYPHCWRCHNPVVFRITFQWFFKIEEIKEQILNGNTDVHWVPDTANNSYESWVRNLKDNSISRQRYWGTPLPIWKCECEEVKVIESRKEIEENGGKVPENIHLPWIDEVEFDCKCGKKMKRVPDVIDVWVDAGTASWNCLNNDPELLKKWWPADYIMEAKEQTRLWFSMLSICSYLYKGENAFKNVYVYGMLNDIDGKKMSKSLGNIISPYELIDKHGVDVLRYYMCQNNAGEDINFSWDECITKSRYLHILWNVHKLLINLAQENKVNPFNLQVKRLETEEKFILSKLNSTIKEVTEAFETYHLDETITPLEELFLELSRTYIQMVRDKSAVGSKGDKEVVIHTIGKVLMDALKMFNIISPFICEAIYQNLRDEFELKEESISHLDWPVAVEKDINEKLEEQVTIAGNLIQGALNAREKARIGLRWPVKELVVVTKNSLVGDAVNDLRDIIGRQTNSKDVVVSEVLPELKIKIKPEFSKIGPVYGELSPKVIAKLSSLNAFKVRDDVNQGAYHFELDGSVIKITKDMISFEHEVPEHYQEAESRSGFVYLNVERTDELQAEGYARELMRHVQNIRKEAGLNKADRIGLIVKMGERMQITLKDYEKDISDKVGASTLTFGIGNGEGSKFKVKEEEFEVWV
jgi:isoleucyl-tRNA synthetase